MKTIIKVLIALITCTLLLSCPKESNSDLIEKIVIKNDSQKRIVYLEVDYGSYNNEDTLLPIQPIIWNNQEYTIEPDSFKNYLLYRFDKNSLDNGIIMMYYFFDPDTLALVPWERIAEENIILKRVDINSWEELEDLNFEITYP